MLYGARSAFFSICFQHSQKHCDQTLILSALHGLVHPDRWLRPYDFKLMGQGKSYLMEWGSKVIEAIAPVQYQKIMMYAGGSYAACLSGIPNLDPAASGSIGYRLQALTSGTRLFEHPFPSDQALELIQARPEGISFRELSMEQYKLGATRAAIMKDATMVRLCPLFDFKGIKIIAKSHAEECL